MKKLLIGLAMLATSSASFADGYHHYRPAYHSHSDSWVAPLIVGGIAGYIIAQPRQQTIIVQQPVYQPLPSYVPATTEPIYQYQDIYDATCGCYRRVLVQIN